MTDFASKYGFALADSDSDEDVSSAAAIFGNKTKPNAQTGSSTQQSTASALFGGTTQPDGAESNETASYFASAPAIQVTVPQQIEPLTQAKAEPPKQALVQPAPKQTPSTSQPSSRVNALLQGLLSDSDESDTDDFLEKYRASKQVAAQPSRSTVETKPSQPEAQEEVGRPQMDDTQAKGPQANSAAALFGGQEEPHHVEPEGQEEMEELEDAVNSLEEDKRKSDGRHWIQRSRSEMDATQQEKVEQSATSGLLQKAQSQALTQEEQTENEIPFSDYFNQQQPFKEDLSGRQTSVPGSEEPIQGVDQPDMGSQRHALQTQITFGTMGSGTQAQSFHQVESAEVGETKATSDLTAANFFANDEFNSTNTVEHQAALHSHQPLQTAHSATLEPISSQSLANGLFGQDEGEPHTAYDQQSHQQAASSLFEPEKEQEDNPMLAYQTKEQFTDGKAQDGGIEEATMQMEQEQYHEPAQFVNQETFATQPEQSDPYAQLFNSEANEVDASQKDAGMASNLFESAQQTQVQEEEQTLAQSLFERQDQATEEEAPHEVVQGSNLYGIADSSEAMIATQEQEKEEVLGQSVSPQQEDVQMKIVTEQDTTARRLFGSVEQETADSGVNDTWAMPVQQEEATEDDKGTNSGGAYAFLDQNEEVEIKIEPIQNVLKFSNLEAVNNSEYQSAIQMDNDYFANERASADPATQVTQMAGMSRQLNVTGQKVHFNFDRNQLDQFFLMAGQEIRTQDLTNLQTAQMSRIAQNFHDKVLIGVKTPAIATLQDTLQVHLRSSQTGELTLNYQLVSHLVQLTLQNPQAKMNSLGLIDLFSEGSTCQHLTGIASLCMSDEGLMQSLSSVALKAGASSVARGRQQMNLELLFDHEKQVNMQGFTWELMTRGHSADGIMFASLFMSEAERYRLFRGYLKQSGYTEAGSPMFTVLTILAGDSDELFSDAIVRQALLQEWKTHVKFLLKILTSAQSPTGISRAKEFLSRLARQLLEERNEVVGYLFLATLTDSFDYAWLQQTAQTNLLNVDLRINALLTILTKLRLKTVTDKTEKHKTTAYLVSCAFYRAICYGQVLQLHEKALDEIHFVVEHRDAKYLPERLRRSKYFEFLLKQMKQASFESMREEEQASKPPASASISLSGRKQSSQSKATVVVPQRRESESSSEPLAKQLDFGAGSSQVAAAQPEQEAEIIQPRSQEPESSSLKDEASDGAGNAGESGGQGGYFGRFKGMFGSAINYVAPTQAPKVIQFKPRDESENEVKEVTFDGQSAQLVREKEEPEALSAAALEQKPPVIKKPPSVKQMPAQESIEPTVVERNEPERPEQVVQESAQAVEPQAPVVSAPHVRRGPVPVRPRAGGPPRMMRPPTIRPPAQHRAPRPTAPTRPTPAAPTQDSNEEETSQTAPIPEQPQQPQGNPFASPFGAVRRPPSSGQAQGRRPPKRSQYASLY